MQRAQALISIGELPAALEACTEDPPDPRRSINDSINHEWVWRLPPVVNHAHLRMAAGEERGQDALLDLVARAEELRANGIVNVDVLYWVASAHAVMGENERALELLEVAVNRGWRHTWWARHDWNWSALRDDSGYRGLLARGQPA